MRHDDGHGSGSIITAFLLGGVVGAALTVLLSPLSGPEARRKLSDLRDDIRDRADEYAHDLREKVDDTVHRGKDFVESKKSVISSAVEAGKDAYRKEREKHESS